VGKRVKNPFVVVVVGSRVVRPGRSSVRYNFLFWS
jgi:hypothetical protein